MANYADYGTFIVNSNDLAKQRGTGNFNPSPSFYQTVDRGPAFSQALNYYSNFQPDTEHKVLAPRSGSVDRRSTRNDSCSDNKLNMINANKNANDISSTYNNLLDKEKREPYMVGTSYFHPQKVDSWESPRHTWGTDEYQEWAAAALRMEPNLLMNFFFSKENVEYILDTIINEVYRLRSIRVGKQSVDELLIIMKNKYEYALSGWLPHPGPKGPQGVYFRGEIPGPNGQAYYDNGLKIQLQRLNESVLEECVKQVISGADMYNKFFNDASTLPMPLDLPVLTSMKGSSVLQENVGFTSGRSKDITSYNERFNII